MRKTTQKIRRALRRKKKEHFKAVLLQKSLEIFSRFLEKNSDFFPLSGFSLTSKAVLFCTVQIALITLVLRTMKNVSTKWP